MVSRLPDGALRASLFGLANVLCSASRFVTVGLEYNCGRRYNKVGSLDNNRFVLGMQIF